MRNKREVLRKVKIDPEDERVAQVSGMTALPNPLGRRYLSDEERARRKALTAERVALRAELAGVMLKRWTTKLKMAQTKVKKFKRLVAYYRKTQEAANGTGR